MTIKLKPITESSWLVIGDTDDIRIGLLSEMRDKYTLMVKGEKKLFLSRKAVNTYFKEDVFTNMIEPEQEADAKTDFFINGYPVDFVNPSEVFIAGVQLPLFNKKATSEVYYSAGYYCLNFPRNWMPAYCPKYSTLQTYEYAGPFKSELEMRTELTRLRKEKNKLKKS